MRQIGKCQMRETCDREQRENATNSIESINTTFFSDKGLWGANSVQMQISEEDCTYYNACLDLLVCLTGACVGNTQGDVARGVESEHTSRLERYCQNTPK